MPSKPSKAFWEAVFLVGILFAILVGSVIYLNGWCRRNDSDDDDDSPRRRGRDGDDPRKRERKNKPKREESEDSGNDSGDGLPPDALRDRRPRGRREEEDVYEEMPTTSESYDERPRNQPAAESPLTPDILAPAPPMGTLRTFRQETPSGVVEFVIPDNTIVNTSTPSTPDGTPPLSPEYRPPWPPGPRSPPPGGGGGGGGGGFASNNPYGDGGPGGPSTYATGGGGGGGGGTTDAPGGANTFPSGMMDKPIVIQGDGTYPPRVVSAGPFQTTFVAVRPAEVPPELAHLRNPWVHRVEIPEGPDPKALYAQDLLKRMMSPERARARVDGPELEHEPIGIDPPIPDVDAQEEKEKITVTNNVTSPTPEAQVVPVKEKKRPVKLDLKLEKEKDTHKSSASPQDLSAKVSGDGKEEKVNRKKEKEKSAVDSSTGEEVSVEEEDRRKQRSKVKASKDKKKTKPNTVRSSEEEDESVKAKEKRKKIKAANSSESEEISADDKNKSKRKARDKDPAVELERGVEELEGKASKKKKGAKSAVSGDEESESEELSELEGTGRRKSKLNPRSNTSTADRKARKNKKAKASLEGEISEEYDTQEMEMKNTQHRVGRRRSLTQRDRARSEARNARVSRDAAEEQESDFEVDHGGRRVRRRVPMKHGMQGGRRMGMEEEDEYLPNSPRRRLGDQYPEDLMPETRRRLKASKLQHISVNGEQGQARTQQANGSQHTLGHHEDEEELHTLNNVSQEQQGRPTRDGMVLGRRARGDRGKGKAPNTHEVPDVVKDQEEEDEGWMTLANEARQTRALKRTPVGKSSTAQTENDLEEGVTVVNNIGKDAVGKGDIDEEDEAGLVAAKEARRFRSAARKEKLGKKEGKAEMQVDDEALIHNLTKSAAHVEQSVSPPPVQASDLHSGELPPSYNSVGRNGDNVLKTNLGTYLEPDGEDETPPTPPSAARRPMEKYPVLPDYQSPLEEIAPGPSQRATQTQPRNSPAPQPTNKLDKQTPVRTKVAKPPSPLPQKMPTEASPVAEATEEAGSIDAKEEEWVPSHLDGLEEEDFNRHTKNPKGLWNDRNAALAPSKFRSNSENQAEKMEQEVKESKGDLSPGAGMNLDKGSKQQKGLWNDAEELPTGLWKNSSPKAGKVRRNLPGVGERMEQEVTESKGDTSLGAGRQVGKEHKQDGLWSSAKDLSKLEKSSDGNLNKSKETVKNLPQQVVATEDKENTLPEREMVQQRAKKAKELWTPAKTLLAKDETSVTLGQGNKQEGLWNSARDLEEKYGAGKSREEKEQESQLGIETRHAKSKTSDEPLETYGKGNGRWSPSNLAATGGDDKQGKEKKQEGLWSSKNGLPKQEEFRQEVKKANEEHSQKGEESTAPPPVVTAEKQAKLPEHEEIKETNIRAKGKPSKPPTFKDTSGVLEAIPHEGDAAKGKQSLGRQKRDSAANSNDGNLSNATTVVDEDEDYDLKTARDKLPTNEEIKDTIVAQQESLTPRADNPSDSPKYPPRAQTTRDKARTDQGRHSDRNHPTRVRPQLTTVAHDNRRRDGQVKKATKSQLRAAQLADASSSFTNSKPQQWRASYLYPLALLAQTTWIIRRAKLWSAATLLAMAGAIEGTRLLGGVILAVADVPALRKRADDDGAAGMADLTGLQDYVKTMAGGTLSRGAVFFLLNVWICLAVPFLAYLVHATITHAHNSLKIDTDEKEKREGKPSLWKNPGMAMSRLLGGLKRGLRRMLGVLFMGQEYRGLHALGSKLLRWRSALRSGIFFLFLIGIVLALRQLLSLASLTLSPSAPNVVSGPDITPTEASLRRADLTLTQIFILFNFVFFLMVPALLWAWYLLLNPSAPLTREERAAKRSKKSKRKDGADAEDGDAETEKLKRAWWIRFICMSKLDRVGPWWLKYVVMVALVAVIGGIAFWVITNSDDGGEGPAAAQ